MSLPTGSAQAIQLVRTARLRIPDLALVESDLALGTLVAKTGPSMKSWGEVITARVQPVGSEESLVHLESRPRLRLTIADFGVNAQNLDLVQTAFRTHESAGPTGTPRD